MAGKKAKPTLEVLNNKTTTEERYIRSVWDSEAKQWYYPVIDIIGVLTDTNDPSDYVKKMKRRDRQLNEEWYSIVVSQQVKTNGGVQPLNCVNVEGAIRIILSIPSQRAEPFKLWLSKIIAEKVTSIIKQSDDIATRHLSMTKTIMSCNIKKRTKAKKYVNPTKNIEKLLVALLNPEAKDATAR